MEKGKGRREWGRKRYQNICGVACVLPHGAASWTQVAGLDVGWSHRLDMHWVSENHRFELKRSMWPGTYQV